jgi:hypothetical protein
MMALTALVVRAGRVAFTPRGRARASPAGALV